MTRCAILCTVKALGGNDNIFSDSKDAVF